MSKAIKNPLNFEAAMMELEQISQSMEEGKMPLDSLLSAYARGTELLRFCQDKLRDTEQQIQILENNQLHILSESAERNIL